MALKEWNTNFRLEYSIGKSKTTFSDVPLLPEIFRWEDPKIRVPFTFHRISRKMFVNGKQPQTLRFQNKLDGRIHASCISYINTANELQQNSDAFFWRRIYSTKINCFVVDSTVDSSHLHLTFVASLVFCLSFVHSRSNNTTAMTTNQSSWPDSGQILCHKYGISVAESQMFLLAKRLWWRRARRNGCIRRLFTCHLNCKYHPWGLINDMQMSIYNRKHWHALSHGFNFNFNFNFNFIS